jgi:hypothetical protein
LPSRGAADAEVLEAVNVALPGGKLLVPDVVVVAAGAVGETTTRIPCEAVLAVVGVVSPSTTAIDRAVRPVMYAEAGIPVYWRVDLQGTPKVVACSLSRQARAVPVTDLVLGDLRSRRTAPSPQPEAGYLDTRYYIQRRSGRRELTPSRRYACPRTTRGPL